MARRYLFYRRKTAIIYTDILLFSVGMSVWGVYIFKYHWSIAIVTLIGLVLGVNYLFFSNKIFRYVFSVLFSLLYGGIAAIIGAYLDKDNPTTPALVLGVLAFLISLYLHKDHFDFLGNSKTVEYDRY